MSKSTSYDFPQETAVVREYDISRLEDNQHNHFSSMSGEQWDEFVGSIREFGIVSPLIIRPKPGSSGKYEILAGHNRRKGAEEAGLTSVPCIEIEADDVNASLLLGITNRQREKVSDLEWGWTYRTTLEALKQQTGGSRSKAAEGSGSIRSIDIVAAKYGVSRRTAQRKIRLTYLVPQLYALGKKLNYSQKLLVDLSYLPPALQTNVAQAVVIEGVSMNEHLAEELRRESLKQELTIDDVMRICRGQGKQTEQIGLSRHRGEDRETPIEDNKTDGTMSRPRKYAVSDALFPDSIREEERENYIAAALRYIRDQGLSHLITQHWLR